MTITTSHGPDPTNCCCDVCGFARISCLGSGEVPLVAICCKCVPKVLCGVFTPDDPDQCPPIGIFMNHAGLGQYHGTLGEQFGFDDTLVNVTLATEDDGTCYWGLQIIDFAIDERKVIDRVYQTCHDVSFAVRLETSYCAGEFVISRYDLSKVPFIAVGHEIVGPCINTATWEANIVASADCTGPGCNYVGVSDPSAPLGLSWQLTSGSCDSPCACQPDGFLGFPRLPDYVGDTLSVSCPGFSDPGTEWLPVSESNPSCCEPSEPPSFNGVLDGDIQTTNCTGTGTGVIFHNPCGDCTEVCGIICVEYTYNGATRRNRYEWNASTNRWIHEINHITDYISLTEDEYGNCVLLPVIAELEDASIAFDPFPMTTCASGMDIVVDSVDLSVSVSIACKPCTCWEHICGSCRCACSVLCLLIYRDGVIDLRHLAWFFDSTTGAAGWSDGYETVTLSKDTITGKCQITIDGFDPVVIDECGTDIQIAIENDQRWQAFCGCEKCICFASPALCCGRYISDLPLKLVCTLAEFDHCGCAGSTFDLIWNPFANWWRGSGTIGDCYRYSNVVVTVGCPDNLGYAAPVSVITSCGDNGIDGGPIEHQADPDSEIVSCDPILIVTSPVSVDVSCCDDGLVDEDPYDGIGPTPFDGMFTLTITE